MACRREYEVEVRQATFLFRKSENTCTHRSYKENRQDIEKLAVGAGFEFDEVWTRIDLMVGIKIRCPKRGSRDSSKVC